jgi:hypothetical protein
VTASPVSKSTTVDRNGCLRALTKIAAIAFKYERAVKRDSLVSVVSLDETPTESDDGITLPAVAREGNFRDE